MKYTAIIAILIMLTSSCRTPEGQAVAPALLSNPGPETLQEIEQSVSSALGGTGVTLADDVFTSNSVLVIQHNLQRGIDRAPELGRDLGRPYRFQLVTDGRQCVLVDEQSGGSWPLTTVECVRE